jgi:hypothetical protein
LQTIQKGSQEKIYLEVYNNGELSQADSVPTLSIYNADGDTTAIAGYSNISATNESPVGKYSYTLNPALTQNNIVLEIRWAYIQNGRSVTQTEFYEVETPYSTPAQTIDFFGMGSTPAEINYHDPKDIVSAEKVARTIINGYTGIKFYTYYGSQEVVGMGSDACEMTERVLTIDKVYENDILIIDNTVSPIYNTFGFPLEVSPTGRQIRITYPGWDLRYDNQIDPTVLYYGRFRDGSRYSFTGQMGYKYIPEDIKLASMLLIQDILSNDYNWRNKYLQKVDLSEISFEMAKGAFNGTGNITVDNILDQYRNMNIVII